MLNFIVINVSNISTHVLQTNIYNKAIKSHVR